MHRLDSLYSAQKVFDLEPLVLNGVEEKVVKGGRHLFPKLKQAFAGVHREGHKIEVGEC